MNLPETISLLHRKMNMELNARLMKYGLSNAKSRLLEYICNNRGITQVELCKELELDKSTVAKILARMESSGLIIKKINPDDVRSFLVFPTSKGIELFPRTREAFLGWTEDVISDMTKAEKELFYKLIGKVTQQAVKICNK